MGYQPKKKIYTLEFEEPEFEGLEVRIGGLNTGQVMDIDAARADGGDAAIVTMLKLLGDRLIEWNVDHPDTSEPVPPTFEGVCSLDMDFNWAIINAWQSAVAGVKAPLDEPSTDGEPSLVASIPMDVLSLPPESTAVPA
ncbi:hypothetical protein [Streptomyces sp. AMCC400023]|uniref:hypothetical protein n=1 Tax=Streptomyces sp. AMCC400023 TaxID=2056258 RepID=UPI001F4854F8|nr:hypothetical protein [Streptomyces sp. AMCC400023]UJV42092.1 hypothetical protein CVT30_21560 [Streptomyces sp. AMCC400023]